MQDLGFLQPPSPGVPLGFIVLQILSAVILRKAPWQL